MRRPILACLNLVIACTIGGAAGASGQTIPGTVSVCDLFEDLQSHKGKTVSVRGMLYTGFEVSALGSQCNSKFVTKYNWGPSLPGIPEQPPARVYVWPTALHMVNSSLAQKEEPVEFETDLESCHKVDLLIERDLAKLKPTDKPEIWITIVGKLLMKDHYVIAKATDGSARGIGYGHLNVYPAQLVVKTKMNPVVRVSTK